MGGHGVVGLQCISNKRWRGGNSPEVGIGVMGGQGLVGMVM